MTTPAKNGCCAIVVTYNPDIEILESVLTAIFRQVDKVCVVDNGSNVQLTSLLSQYGNVKSIFLCINRGIAAGLNAGLLYSKSAGFKYSLFLDQDSIASQNMVEKLLEGFEARGQLVCIGPRYVDPRQNNPPPFIQARGLRLKRWTCEDVDAIVPVDYLITSGCMVPLDVFDRVGFMREDLFIDYVDIEWGLRARHLGVQSLGMCGATMHHSLGDDPIRFMGRKIPVRSPLRHYYHFRNAVLLYQEPWIPVNWKLIDMYKLLRKYFFYSLFTKQRVQHLKMMSLGIWHGMVNKKGPY